MNKSSVIASSHIYDLLGSLDQSYDVSFWEESERQAQQEGLVTRLTAEVETRARLLTGRGVTLPTDLIPRITEEVTDLAQKEPCGIRGGVIYVTFEDESMKQLLTRVVVDEDIPNTFELHLTLRPDTSSFYQRMAKMIRSLRKNSPLLISSCYTLEKKKLYPDE